MDRNRCWIKRFARRTRNSLHLSWPMCMDHMPGPTSHLVREARCTKLFSNAHPREIAFVAPERVIDVLAQQRECWHPSAKESVGPLLFSTRQWKHVIELCKQGAKFRGVAPRCRGRLVHGSSVLRFEPCNFERRSSRRQVLKRGTFAQGRVATVRCPPASVESFLPSPPNAPMDDPAPRAVRWAREAEA